MHKEVREAAVSIIENKKSDKEIVAAIIRRKGSQETAANLLVYCKKYLPAYAVPSQVRFMSEFPRTSSGKIKRSEISKLISN